VNVAHLTGRFFGSLRRRPPSPGDLAWAESVLGPEAYALWRRQPVYDQRHSLAVARAVQSELEGGAFAGDDRWIACALLHDIGKLDSRLGVYGRVVATVASAAAGPGMADAWSDRSGFTRRVGLYLRHAELGADRIRLAGGPEEAARWAAGHHTSPWPDDLGIPEPVARALDACDND
jgi:hypothetical protein